MKKQAKVTSKGQVTIPREIRRRLGVRAGDKLEFEEDAQGVRVKAVRDGARYAALIGMTDARATLVIDSSPTEVDRTFLDRHWFGQAYVLWRDFEGLGAGAAAGTAKSPRFIAASAHPSPPPENIA